jgi:hypothetical protein
VVNARSCTALTLENATKALEMHALRLVLAVGVAAAEPCVGPVAGYYVPSSASLSCPIDGSSVHGARQDVYGNLFYTAVSTKHASYQTQSQIRLRALDGSCTVLAGVSGYRDDACPATSSRYVNFDLRNECFYRLEGMAITKAGALLAADSGNARVVWIDLSEGSLSIVASSGLVYPVAVAENADGFILIVDVGLNAVVRASRSGAVVVVVAGASPSSPGFASACANPAGLGSSVPVSASALCLSTAFSPSTLALDSDGRSFLLADAGT